MIFHTKLPSWVSRAGLQVSAAGPAGSYRHGDSDSARGRRTPRQAWSPSLKTHTMFKFQLASCHDSDAAARSQCPAWRGRHGRGSAGPTLTRSQRRQRRRAPTRFTASLGHLLAGPAAGHNGRLSRAAAAGQLRVGPHPMIELLRADCHGGSSGSLAT